MTHRYILRDGVPVPEPDLHAWGRWLESADQERRMAVTVRGDVTISTVFLGLDYNFRPVGRPLLFETMVFGGPHDQELERYATREEALAGHERMVRLCLPDSPSAHEQAA